MAFPDQPQAHHRRRAFQPPLLRDVVRVIGLAAKWSYWLATAVVAIFILQLLVWTFNWVLMPTYRHLQALWRYLRGHGQWYEVAHMHGVRIFRPKWVGPRGREEWTSGYVQQEVRGRGEGREPLDLLVTDGTAMIARLRHGTLRGRTNRFGFKAECDAVHASSHRYFRNQLEGMECRVHLCAAAPCGQPDDDCLHVVASAVIPRASDLDLQDVAGKGPVARCATAAWLFGYTGMGICGGALKACKRCLMCLCCIRCCKRRGKVRNRAPPNSETSTPRHEDSETESEVDDGTSCQAESVAFMVNGKAHPLSLTACKDSAKGEKIRLLQSDADVSSAEDLRHEDGCLYFNSCNHHRAIYEGQAAKRTCAIEGCDREVKVSKGGLRLCKLHGAKEDRTRANRTKSGLIASPKPAPPEKEDKSEGTAACLAPGIPTEARSSGSLHRAAMLGVYLRGILEGKDEIEALRSCQQGDCGPREAWEELKEHANSYVTKLPRGYPPAARRAIIFLVTEECPVKDSVEEVAQDPVLNLVTTDEYASSRETLPQPPQGLHIETRPRLRLPGQPPTQLPSSDPRGPLSCRRGCQYRARVRDTNPMRRLPQPPDLDMREHTPMLNPHRSMRQQRRCKPSPRRSRQRTKLQAMKRGNLLPLGRQKRGLCTSSGGVTPLACHWEHARSAKSCTIPSEPPQLKAALNCERCNSQ